MRKLLFQIQTFTQEERIAFSKSEIGQDRGIPSRLEIPDHCLRAGVCRHLFDLDVERAHGIHLVGVHTDAHCRDATSGPGEALCFGVQTLDPPHRTIGRRNGVSDAGYRKGEMDVLGRQRQDRRAIWWAADLH